MFTSAGWKRQHGDKDMLSNWRSPPRPDAKSSEQGRPYNRRNREVGRRREGGCHSACNIDPRIASPRMLLNNFSPMTGTASPNRFGGLHGEKDQHGRAARGRVGGDGALPVGQTGGEGADPRRAVRDDGLASQACGACTPATRGGWA